MNGIVILQCIRFLDLVSIIQQFCLGNNFGITIHNIQWYLNTWYKLKLKLDAIQ